MNLPSLCHEGFNSNCCVIEFNIKKYRAKLLIPHWLPDDRKVRKSRLVHAECIFQFCPSLFMPPEDKDSNANKA